MDVSVSQAPAYVLEAAVAYGLDFVEILAPQKGYRNQSFPIRLVDDRMVNFILYKHEIGILEKIRNANAVANFTASAALPARASFDARILRLRSQNEVRFGALYTYLDGETIAWEAYTKQHVKLLGGMLSTLHTTLQSVPCADKVPPVAQEYERILGRMHQYFSEVAIDSAIQQKLNITIKTSSVVELKQFVHSCTSLPDQQVLHMDFVRGNILFRSNPKLQISGILDFEKTARGHRAFDIARTLAFLLVDCKYKTADKIYKYFLDSGYNKRGASSFHRTYVICGGQKYDLLETLLNVFLLHDFYKFLRHNPYESLADNEHFVRTRDILIARGLISTVNKH